MIPQPPPYPVVQAPPRPTERGDQRAWLAAGIAGIAGGSITSSVAVSQLPLVISGRSGLPGSVTALLVGQLVFGLAVVMAAYLLAPGPLPARLLAAGIFVVGAVMTIGVATLRISGAAPVPRMIWPLFNAYAPLLLAGAAGWLIACGARGLAYLTLLATLVVFPLNWVLVRGGISSPFGTIVTLALCLLIAVGVLLASRPARR